MDNLLDDLQQMLVETESIHQTLAPLCSRFKVACRESYQDRNLQDLPVSSDRSQPVSHSMESGNDNVSAADSGISDGEKKLAMRCQQLQNELDALKAKFLEADNKLQKLEVQAIIDKETSDLARGALAEQIQVHKKAAEEANTKLAKALSETSTSAVTTAALPLTPPPGSISIGHQYHFK
jgi:hypothetical protein